MRHPVEMRRGDRQSLRVIRHAPAFQMVLSPAALRSGGTGRFSAAPWARLSCASLARHEPDERRRHCAQDMRAAEARAQRYSAKICFIVARICGVPASTRRARQHAAQAFRDEQRSHRGFPRQWSTPSPCVCGSKLKPVDVPTGTLTHVLLAAAHERARRASPAPPPRSISNDLMQPRMAMCGEHPTMQRRARRWFRNARRPVARRTRRTDCRPDFGMRAARPCSNCTRQRLIPPSVLRRGFGRVAPMKVQVCIVGGGPSGLLLSQLLHLQGIETVVLRSTRATMCWRRCAPACWSTAWRG